ncbi:major facilitator superfamily domain-containing protein 6-like [Penaeus monodon]|uniref:major facilitator superfamily domain-containing protein 6-like n=1 Tax=Penaeus monodon TaxID=6687 RepID=UPI0018A6ED5C|nr:major facilitator superfamily domain-containing protein 6-like [Penaeus monodon]
MWEKLVRDMKINLFSADLMPLKFLFFMLFAANTTLYPYLAVHLQSLGFGADKAAVVFAIIPLVSIMGPPVAGAVADKIGNFKLFFSVMVAVSGLLSLFLLVIPAVPVPPGLSLTLLTDHLEPEYQDVNKLAEVLPKEESGKTVDAEYLQFIVITNQSGCDIYDEYQTTMDGINKINIGSAEPKATANLTLIQKTSNFSLMAVTTHHPLYCPTGVPLRPLSKGAEALLPEILMDYNTSALDMKNGNLSTDEDAWWRSGCDVKVPGLCEPHHADIIGAEALSFWTYLFARTFLNGAVNAAFTLFEGATLSLLKRHEGDYGLQRLWGYMGSMVFTPFSGWLIDTMSYGSSTPDFRPAFYLFVGLQGLAGLVALSVDLKFKPPSDQVIKNIWRFLHNVEVIMLFVAMGLSGAFFGFLEAFLFWFLGDLGASRSLMGLTVTVGAAAAIPLLIVMTPIVRKFGHICVIAMGFLGYAIRFAGYASIYNPVSALYFEALEGVTMGLMLSAGMTYASELSTTKTVVSLQALSGTLHYGVGKGAGSLVGGYMYHHLGARKTFRLMTVASLLSAIIFFIFHIFINHRNKLRKLNNEDVMLIDDEEMEIIKLKETDKSVRKVKRRENGKTKKGLSENGIYEYKLRVAKLDAETQTDDVVILDAAPAEIVVEPVTPVEPTAPAELATPEPSFDEPIADEPSYVEPASEEPKPVKPYLGDEEEC